MGLILPNHIEEEKEIAKLKIDKYKGFYRNVFRIANAYNTIDELKKVLPSVDPKVLQGLTGDFIWFGTAMNPDLKVVLYQVGETQNEAGQKLTKIIDIILKQKIGIEEGL